MRMVAVLAAFALSASLLGEDKEKLKSGSEKGAGTPPFDVKDITGPNSHKNQLCYV